MPTEVQIYFHDTPLPDLATSDAGTVAVLRDALGGPDDHLVMAREFAEQLRAAGRDLWANRLAAMEEPHMVRVVFTH